MVLISSLQSKPWNDSRQELRYFRFLQSNHSTFKDNVTMLLNHKFSFVVALIEIKKKKYKIPLDLFNRIKCQQNLIRSWTAAFRSPFMPPINRSRQTRDVIWRFICFRKRKSIDSLLLATLQYCFALYCRQQLVPRW